VLGDLAVPAAGEADASFCAFDDGITFRLSDGTALDDEVVLEHGTVRFALQSGRWLVVDIAQSDSSSVSPGTPNPCDGGGTGT
jgi:hypothetical protein